MSKGSAGVIHFTEGLVSKEAETAREELLSKKGTGRHEPLTSPSLTVSPLAMVVEFTASVLLVSLSMISGLSSFEELPAFFSSGATSSFCSCVFICFSSEKDLDLDLDLGLDE